MHMRLSTTTIMLMVSLFGCASSTRHYVEPPSGDEKKVSFVDPSLEEKVSIVTLDEHEVNGFVEIQIGIENRSERIVRLEIKVDFYDRAGFQLQDVWDWRPMRIDPNETEYLKERAPQKGPVSFEIKIRTGV